MTSAYLILKVFITFKNRYIEPSYHQIYRLSIFCIGEQSNNQIMMRGNTGPFVLLILLIFIFPECEQCQNSGI
jgi:hypothetical protein